MTITQSTTMQAYQLKAGGVRARMAILRMIAAESTNNPGDWKKARRYTMGDWEAAYCAGFNQGDPGVTWYTHGGKQFRNERELSTGWYTDEHCDDTAIGVVAPLPHGRYIAGYTWTCNGERVYFSQVFDDEDDAARMADEHARVFAEVQREYEQEFEQEETDE